MTIRMENVERLSLAEMEEFVSHNRHGRCAVVERGTAYGFIERVLTVQPYRRLSKGQKGIVRRFLGKISGLSRAQLTRLIRRWMDRRRIERQPARRPSCPRRYTAADIALLAEAGQPGYPRVDTVHQGQHDGQPGVYPINAVDTVRQWQVVGCVETICERHLIPVLEAMLPRFRLISGLENAPAPHKVFRPIRA